MDVTFAIFKKFLCWRLIEWFRNCLNWSTRCRCEWVTSYLRRLLRLLTCEPHLRRVFGFGKLKIGIMDWDRTSEDESSSSSSGKNPKRRVTWMLAWFRINYCLPGLVLPSRLWTCVACLPARGKATAAASTAARSDEAEVRQEPVILRWEE